MPIKDRYADRWKEINEDLNAMKEKKLQRFIGNKKAELLCFCEASSKEYGKTIYLRCQENCQTITNLTRITPIKETSLPRLELLAILVGTRSINFITQSLQLRIHCKTLLTDSKCVLHWLKSKKILTPFVQRRIDEIQSNKRIEFRYGIQNPADIASRGCTVKILNGNKFWWHGPTWLQKHHDDWPARNVNILSKDIMDALLTENKGPSTLYEVSSLAEEDLANNKQEDRKENIKKNQPPPFEIKATDYYSSMSRLLRVTAWADKFIHNTRAKKKRRDWLNDKELKKTQENNGSCMFSLRQESVS